jgi:hypothetical protein
MKEVQAMLLNCDKGLTQVTREAPLLGPMAELWLVHPAHLTVDNFDPSELMCKAIC